MNILNLQEKNKILEKLLNSVISFYDETEKHVQSNFSDNCIYCYNVGILNIFDPELRLINASQWLKEN